MTGKQLKITRSYKSVRFNAPETIDSRALSFLKSQNPTLDFSPEFSTKALTLKKKPSADNTVKRKKGKGAYTRYGVAVFNPNERWSPGKVFIPWIMKHGRGSGDDTPNVGWVTPPKTIEPKDVQKTVKELVAFRKTRAGYTYEDSKPNPRTGGFQEKALGPSIGTLVPGGDIGARAASKLGLVVDALGKLRCPAGVPAANQFTDSVGSNCFDFLPEVAKKLLEQSIQFGRQQMSDLRLLNNVEQTARRDSGLIIPSDTGLIVPNAQNLIIPHILGADGKILSITPTISPVVYAETVRAQLARDYPNIDMEERNRIVKLAEQRVGMVQTVNGKIKTALDYLTELGIEFDENDPLSLTAALLSGIQKLKENGWDIDYERLLWGDGEMVNNKSLSMKEKVALHIKGVINTAWEIVSEDPDRYLGKDADKKFADLGGDEESEKKRIVNAILNNDVSSLPPGHKVVAEAISGRLMDYYASEHGFLMSILAEHKENPADVELIQKFEIIDPMRIDGTRDPDTVFLEAMVIPTEDGKLAMRFNPIGMMMDNPPSAPIDGKWRLYKSNGNGLEIEQIQEISRVVDAHQRKVELNTFLNQANPLDSTNNEGKHLNTILEEHAGRLGRSMFIFQHELTHAKQYSLLAYLISHDPDGKRLKGMTNAEVLVLVDELIGGRNSLMSYESIMSDPRVMASAFAEFGPMLEALVENGMAGAYPQEHLHAMNILSEVLSLPPSQRLQAADNLNREFNNLSTAKASGFITTEEEQRLTALGNALSQIETILQNPDDNTLEGAIRIQRALMVAEAMAELNAGVKMGLIQPTDEIKQVLEHINGSMDQVHKFKNSLEEHGRLKFVVEQDEFGRRIEKLDFNYFDRKKRTKGDITGESYTERQKRLIGDDDPITIMDSTESHKSKKSLVSHFSGIRERVMQRATEKQKKAINEELPEQNDARLITQDGLLISELADSSNIREGLSKGKTFDKKLEEDIIPILDLMENNPLEEDTAVVVDVGNVKRSKNPNRVTFMEFVNFVRAGIALNKQKYDTDDFPRENQKMIVKVPKGSRGIPDFDFAPRVPDSVVAPRQPPPEPTWPGKDQGFPRPYYNPKMDPMTYDDDNPLALTDDEVEELVRRYEEDKAKRRGPRGRRESNDRMVDEEIRQVAAEKLRDQIERTRNRVAAGGLRSSSAPSRTTPEKIERGPTNLTYGRGEDGTPAMASIDELEQRYGKTPKEIKKYFSTRYGVDIGISKKIFKGTDTRDREKLNAAYGALQAMEDVFENVDIKALTGRDNLSIRLVAGATLDDSWGQFSAIEKWFSRTRFGDNNTKSGIDVNLENLTGSSSDPRGLSENYDRYWKEATVRDKVVGNMTAMFAQLGMPDGYEPQFPGLDDPGYKEWAAIAEEVRQRLAYGVMVHEIGHYLDFSQRDDSDETTPPLILSLLNGDFGSNRTDNPKIFGTDSSNLPDSFVNAPSVSRYGSSTKQEKLAEAFLSWFVIAGTERASRVDYLEPRDSETVNIIETYRQSINDILLPMFEKLGPRVKSAKKDKQSERFAMTSTLPLAALINSISPFTDILNKNKVSKSSPRGSISSMLLAPGKVKVVGTRKDGTLVGRLVQQDTPMKSLSRLEDKLKKFISNPHTNASHKVEARRALSVITARREAELATNSRSPSTQGGTAVLKIPLTINTNSKQILEKLEDIGATWGEPLSEAIAMKNTYSGGRSSLSNNTRFESDQQSIAIIDAEIKKLLSLMKKDKTAMKSLFPEVLKRIQSMTPDELKKNLVKAAREYVSGIDKRPRFRFSDNTVNSPESETTFDKFIDSGTWEVGSKNIDNPVSVDAEYSLRLGIPEDVTSEIQLVRGHFLHKDEIRKRIIRAQSQIEKNRASFEDRGINPAKIKPEFLPESMSVGEYGEKDSLNPFSSQQGQIEVILKPETVHRTLMTLGDSFNEARTVINLDTDLSDEQLLIAILRTRWGGNGEVSGFKVTDLTTQQIIINLLNASIGKGGYGDITKGSEGNRHYSEAIIADGFNLDEVEEILLSVNYVKKQMGDSVVEPNLAQATQVLSRLSVNDDLINAENIILNPKTPTEVSAARELKKKIAYVQQIKKQRQLRAEFARRINASVRSGNGPRVVFPNIDGLDYDDPKTYKNYLENMSVDELLDERMATDVREIMKNLGRKVATSEQVRQARQKPKAEVGAS